MTSIIQMDVSKAPFQPQTQKEFVFSVFTDLISKLSLTCLDIISTTCNDVLTDAGDNRDNKYVLSLWSRPAQIFFGQKVQTPQGTLGQKVSALQF